MVRRMASRKTPGISGLDKFGLTKRRLGSLGSRQVTLEVYLHEPPHLYPSRAMFRKLLRVPPERRREMMYNWRVEALRKLRRELPFRDYQVIGASRNPFGLRFVLPGRAVSRLFRCRHASSICIERIEGLKRRRGIKMPSGAPRLYAVTGKFAFQWERQRRGMQLCEERLFLLIAKSERDARRRAGQEFRSHTFPSLHPTSGHFRRWAFEGIVDVCEPNDREFSPMGTEVFYAFRNRRMRRIDEWHPK
jgi:hypothetical protein